MLGLLDPLVPDTQHVAPNRGMSFTWRPHRGPARPHSDLGVRTCVFTRSADDLGAG